MTRTLDTLADTVAAIATVDADELRQAASDFAFGDLNLLAASTIVDLTEGDQLDADTADAICALSDASYAGLVFALATRLHVAL